MTIEIVNLRDCPEHLEELGRWHHEQWAELNPGLTLKRRFFRMKAYLNSDFIPTSWLAFSEGKAVGSAAVVNNDMDIRPEYSPWLASVFVLPGYRGRGIGTLLIRHAMKHSAEAGEWPVYLFTPDRQD